MGTGGYLTQTDKPREIAYFVLFMNHMRLSARMPHSPAGGSHVPTHVSAGHLAKVRVQLLFTI